MDRFTPYEGKKPFIFTSYARGDTLRMLQVMNSLRESDYRVWYDEGIPGGNDWPLYIARHMNDAGAVVFFLSGSSLVSPNCFSEMKAADGQKKTVICLALDDSGRIIRAALREGRELTAEESRRIREETAELARRRSSGVRLPAPEEWLPVLTHAVFPEGQTEAEAILGTGLLTEEFRGPYEDDRRGRRGFNRWILAIIACVVLLSGLSWKGATLYASYTAITPTPASAEATPPPRPTVDPSLVEGLMNSNISFPDDQQRRAVQLALKTTDVEIEDVRLQGITSLVFCGKTVLSSREGIAFRDGKWYANGAPVAQGEIKDLSLLEIMYYLEELTLVDQEVSSVEELRSLQVLRYLDISGNPIEEPVLSEGFPGLETLNISHTGIRSLVSDSYPPSLKTVYVSGDMLPMELPADAPFEVVLTR